MDKEWILDTIVRCKGFLNRNPDEGWSAYQCTKSNESNLVEICGRYLRRNGYDVKLSYGTLKGYNNCYLTVSNKTPKEVEVKQKKSLLDKVRRHLIVKYM